MEDEGSVEIVCESLVLQTSAILTRVDAPFPHGLLFCIQSRTDKDVGELQRVVSYA